MNKPRDRRSPSTFTKVARLLTGVYCGAVGAAILTVAGLIYVPGERWWLTTLVLFGPIWLLEVAWVAGLGAWLILHRGIALGLGLLVTQAVLLVPVMAYQLPLPGRSQPEGPETLRVVTWNLGGRRLSHTDALRLFDTFRADVVVLQECGGVPSDPGVAELASLERHESTGMCMLSRFPVTDIADRDRKDVWEASGSGAIVRYTFNPPWGAFTLTNVHLETPREGLEALLYDGIGLGIETLSAKNSQRYIEAALAFEWTERNPPLPRLVAGDFNTTPQSDLLRNTWNEYTNCFTAVGSGFGYTKQTKLLAARIDHVLASPQWSCVSAEPLEGFESDHRPLLTVTTLARP